MITPKLNVDLTEPVCICRLTLPNLDGEHRYFIAPRIGGGFHIWGDYHAPGEDQPSDAAYDFAAGGADCRTQKEALAFAYQEISRIALQFSGQPGTAVN